MQIVQIGIEAPRLFLIGGSVEDSLDEDTLFGCEELMWKKGTLCNSQEDSGEFHKMASMRYARKFHAATTFRSRYIIVTGSLLRID